MPQGLGNVDPRYLQKVYSGGEWNTAILTFISTTQNADQLTGDFLKDVHNGYVSENPDNDNLVELESLGDSIRLATGEEKLLSANYLTISKPLPDKMRPLNSFNELCTARKAILHSVEYYAIDVTKSDSDNQDATVRTEVSSSASNVNDAWMQTKHFGTIPVTWFPNFFRPKFIINKQNVFPFSVKTNEFSNGTGDAGKNRADMSIGDILPWGLNVHKLFDKGINTIESRAFVGQIVDVSGVKYLKRFPLFCRAILTYQKG